ncbi:MAG: formate--phosphoribosylaminoimidazolecarboxamide ligase family protein [Nitrososphaerota archaeon]
MRPSIAVLASHSALDVLDGAKDEGLRTIAIARRGRERAYRSFPVSDRLIVVDDYAEIAGQQIQQALNSEESIFIPNRSFAVYVGYDRIEKEFNVPVFGNKFLLRWEERTGSSSYYRLLDEAGIRRPRTYTTENFEGPVLVKVPELKRRVERAFIIAGSRKDLEEKAGSLAARGLLDLKALDEASVEEYVLGAHFNANYFYSPLLKRTELHSIDRRIQSNLDGVFRTPARDQLTLDAPVRYIEVGHEPATIRESLLERLFEMGERFVEATKRLVPPGIIGPFTLQFIVTPELDTVVYDVATRIGGGTNVYMGIGSQYSKLYFRRPVTMGRRIAMEILQAYETGSIKELTT